MKYPGIRDSFDSRNKAIHFSEKRNLNYNERPTPIDFDLFIPWYCLELQVPKNIVVTRTYEVEYVRYDSKASKLSYSKSCKLKSRHTKSKLVRSSIQSNYEDKIISVLPKVSLFVNNTVSITDAIPVTACYDKFGRLVEIAIVGCPFVIPQKVIKAFNLCLPFHTGLSKLSIKKGGLCQNVLYELSKLLPHSNITEVCLDDSRVPGLNYSILLEKPSQVKYLSLKRCDINDQGCLKIASKLDINGPALKTLLLLDLTSNNITDDGAQALGVMLKYNRYLIYLNLSGNRISDGGASYIFQYLQEFPLSFDDVKQKRRRRIDYLISKSIIYEKCLQDVKLARRKSESTKDSSNNQVNQTINIPHQSRRKRSKKYAVPSFTSKMPSFTAKEQTVEDEAERKTKETVGDFQDPFADEYIKRNGDLVYCIGNLTLKYVNLAYNNLSLLSIRKILQILKYHSEISNLTTSAGLLQIVMDGNNIPIQCDELNAVDVYLKQARERVLAVNNIF